MRKRKVFSASNDIYNSKLSNDAKSKELDKVLPAHEEKYVVSFPANQSSTRNFDFSCWYNRGIDPIVSCCFDIVNGLLEESVKSKENKLSIVTVSSYCTIGLRHFLPFCLLIQAETKREMKLSDIDRQLINRYISHLASSGKKKTTQKGQYTKLKSILKIMIKKGLIARDIFPKNPYPNINRQYKGQRALSSFERKHVLTSLKLELKRISTEKGSLGSFDLSVCALAIAARTGLNTTPLLELPVDCLQPHPLKLDRQLLVSYKRRGNSSRVHSLRKSENIELYNTVMMHTAQIIEMIKERNLDLRNNYNSTEKLFTYEPNDQYAKRAVILTSEMLHVAIKRLVTCHELVNDDGNPLELNVMRLRKTFENRIWTLSGQDPMVTAALGGHSIKVSNDHYLEAPRESEKNWRMMGEIRVSELLETGQKLKSDYENTPVARCKDSQYGHRAPKNGNHCTDFLNCFRCKSFVITGDDLYRLFSLYWLLINERKNIGVSQWSRYYAHIIRIIDRQVVPQFGTDKIKLVREKARKEPHPFWQTREQLGDGF